MNDGVLMDVTSDTNSSSVFIKRVALKNYKSIAGCNIELGPLTFLVGPNGSGKSNFLDSLAFVRDSLRNTLDNALRDRGGINEVRRRSGGHPTHFGIRLEFVRDVKFSGHYAFMIGARPAGGFEVQKEECKIEYRNGSRHFYIIESGKLIDTTEKTLPVAIRDRLYLVNASGIEAFRPLYDLLIHMGFYNLNPKVIRDLQPPDPGILLGKEGENIASVIGNLEGAYDQRKKKIIDEYLSKIVPSVHGVNRRSIGPRETLEFKQDVAGAKYPWKFLSSNMSDGTLRAFGILVAAFQGEITAPISLVGIEEPETALHPGAAGILLEALRYASQSTQIVVTSHSADLLDSPSIQEEEIMAVASEENVTKVAPIDMASREALKKNLFTVGELLRLNQLVPDEDIFTQMDSHQIDLFGS